MTTEPFDPGATQDAIDDAYQEVIDEQGQEAEEARESVDTPVEDPYAQAAIAISNPDPPAPDVVSKEYLDNQLGAFARAIREDVTSVVASLSAPVEEEMTPDVRAFETMLIGDREVDPEQRALARREFIAYRDSLAAQEAEQSVPEILQDIQTKISNLENQRSQPVAAPVWSEQEVQEITNAINYAARGTGLNINFSDETQLNAVLHGVTRGEDAESAIRKVYANVNRISNAANQTNSNLANSVAETIPNMGGVPTERSDSAIETREDFLEAVADGRLSIGEYPRYAHLFS